MSRVLLVFSGEVKHTHVFTELHHDEELWKRLTADIKAIYNMFGEFQVTEEAMEAINAWAKTGGAPAPDHPKLVSYCSRRIAHVLKLCIIASASSDDDMIITLDHFAEALDWLVELETYMPDIFKSLKVGGDARAIEECWHFAYQYWMKRQEPVPEHLVYAFLQERVPVHSVERMINVMCQAKLLKKQFTASGAVGYEPKGKT